MRQRGNLRICSSARTENGNRMSGIARILSLAFVMSCTCCAYPSEYEHLPHKEPEQLSLKAVIMDTLYIDAGKTSLSGEWHMRDSTLLFIDRYIVGVKEYSTDGTLVGEHILQGRGPGEMIAPTWSSAIDGDGNLIMQDTNCFLYEFDKDYKETFNLKSAWFNKLQDGFGMRSWDSLLHNPDPEAPMMYEYNYETGRNLYHENVLYMPIITEHVSYNGYNIIAHARKFWRQSYCFMSFDPHSLSTTKRLFLHYPPAYRKRNIPIFSTYDFTLRRDSILVSFSADPKIYVLDLGGALQYSFGHADPDISGKYPKTTSFDEYERQYDSHRSQYGFYGRLKFTGEYLFRTCKTDSGEWKMQIYRGNVLSGEFRITEPLEIIGEYGGIYFAAAKEDLRNEKFRIVRFRLDYMGTRMAS